MRDVATAFCSRCGSQYTAEGVACPRCAALLGDDADLVYEMDEWEEEERRALDALLEAEGIPHRWDGDDLLVPDADEERVDSLMDQVEFPDALPLEDGDVDDEAVYAMMSDLFVAADRLASERVVEDELARDLVTAAAAATTAPVPFGLEPASWAQVQQLAEGIVAEIEADADDEVIVRDAASLRDVLRRFV